MEMHSHKYKMDLIKRYLKEEGIWFTIKKIISSLLRFTERFIKRDIFLIELFYGKIPGFIQKLPFFEIDSGLIKLSKNQLVQEVRNFWYSNTPGDFRLDGERISRREIFIYGGPDPKFTCSICQKSEWLSRVKQRNLFIDHLCHSSERCRNLCSRQGSELWTNFHQNFDFSIGCDANLPAPKCLCILPEDKKSEAGGFYQRFQTPGCDQWMLVFRRRLAFTCQTDVVRNPRNINWSDYDFIFVPNTGSLCKFPRFPIPIILYGHDYWPLGDKGFQWVIDWLQPDILLTPYPTQWRENFRFPLHTKIVFYPFFESLFFTRPNLDQKKIDLLVIGSIHSPVYKERILLDEQIRKLANTNKYNIEFSHSLPLSASWKGSTVRRGSVRKKPIYYLNKWSEYLGSAKYVIFGRMKYPVLVSKYYETLGSGAIPIFPEVPDLVLLKVKPFQHYIPLSEVEGNNERLAYLLDHYQDFQYIAKNAVEWYRKVSEKMLFEDFESLIREITNYRYPKRLI